MKRDYKKLPKWKDFEKELMGDAAFRKQAENEECKYQIARRMIELRLKNHLSQKEMAKRVGTRQPVISRLETGEEKPSVSLLERIAEAMKMRLEIRFVGRGAAI